MVRMSLCVCAVRLLVRSRLWGLQKPYKSDLWAFVAHLQLILTAKLWCHKYCTQRGIRVHVAIVTVGVMYVCAHDKELGLGIAFPFANKIL